MSDLGDSMGGVDVKLPFLATAEKDLTITLSMFKEMLSNTYGDLTCRPGNRLFYSNESVAMERGGEGEKNEGSHFVRQFEKLRASLLPEVGISSDEATE